jgi:hypothetical protein
MQGQTVRQPAKRAWLWGLRITTALAAVPMMLAIFVVDSEYISHVVPSVTQWSIFSGLLLICSMSVGAILPYAMVLWLARRAQLDRRGYELSVSTASFWCVFCSALILEPFVDRKSLTSHLPREHLLMMGIFVGVWAIVGFPHALMLVSATRAYSLPEEQGHSIDAAQNRRYVTIKAAMVASSLLVVLPNISIFSIIRRVLPATGLVLLYLMTVLAGAIYLLFLRRLRQDAWDSRTLSLVQSMALAWLILLCMTGLLLWLAGPSWMTEVQRGWTFVGYWITFGVVQALVFGVSYGICFQGRRTEGGRRLWTILMPPICLAYSFAIFLIYATVQ